MLGKAQYRLRRQRNVEVELYEAVNLGIGPHVLDAEIVHQRREVLDSDDHLVGVIAPIGSVFVHQPDLVSQPQPTIDLTTALHTRPLPGSDDRSFKNPSCRCSVAHQIVGDSFRAISLGGKQVHMMGVVVG